MSSLRRRYAFNQVENIYCSWISLTEVDHVAVHTLLYWGIRAGWLAMFLENCLIRAQYLNSTVYTWSMLDKRLGNLLISLSVKIVRPSWISTPPWPMI